ncbi:MAG: oligopeptide/dipeptide ABC transporter ATP-binding protein [Parvibaculaceae bacterium]
MIIEAAGISVRFGSARILESVDFSVDKGETVGIVGESGSGKTTLARTLLGLIPHFEGTIRTKAFGNLRRETAMMFQDPVGSLSPRLSVGSLITEPFVIHGEPMTSRRAKAEELLALVGLTADFARRYPHELSGGQARRVGVARALALKPKLVIADEPTAGLDVSIQGEILNLMTSLKRKFDLAYVIVTHNLAVIRHVSDRLVIMYLGRVVEEGPTREVFANPAHPYSASLIASEPVPDPRRRRANLAITGEVPSILARPKGCEFHTRCPRVAERCRIDAPPLSDLGSRRKVRCHFPLQQGGRKT